MEKICLEIRDRLVDQADKEYQKFHSSLMPGIDSGVIIGVRVPIVRKIAAEYKKNPDIEVFLNNLPHKYYEENNLHMLLISDIKDYETCLKRLDEFLPYVDNWATCDISSPSVFKKNKDKLIEEIKKWVKSEYEYTVRYGIEILMKFYLDDDFREEYLAIAASVKSDKYYVNMMQAWFFATALAKQYEATIGYLENHVLDRWVHNKTIQKSVESYRVTTEHKEYLKGLKMKV